MAETINMETLYRELLSLRKEVHEIKNCMTEINVVMSPEEEAKLEEALEFHKAGKTKSMEDLRKELGD